jgi:sulfoxide reductase catalytic subunit YedY
MSHDRPPRIPASEITPHPLYLRRRALIKAAVAGGLLLPAGSATRAFAQRVGQAVPLRDVKPSGLSTDEKRNTLDEITHYNNFYEFGLDKTDPAENAHTLAARPWTVRVEGEIAKPKTYDIDELLKLAPLEERVYRMRCVEGWSMVIPWVGYSLAELVKRAQPTGNAKFVEYVTLNDPKQMPGVRSGVLDWPYTEGLRLDEAMHPLTLLTVGLYGQALPNQNGAPVRIVVPWKYGFKSGKSVVAIRFTENMPRTAWTLAAPREYGFYSNVNPDVDHPRWSQGSERRIGEFGKRKTLPFNGYAAQVASLYAGMDLRKNF